MKVLSFGEIVWDIYTAEKQSRTEDCPLSCVEPSPVLKTHLPKAISAGA
ncbi:MAG: hypothetical protein IKI29_04620 [Clostridia bacterium]|nr:hypothetical protein [Clostridia bacterium]